MTTEQLIRKAERRGRKNGIKEAIAVVAELENTYAVMLQPTHALSSAIASLERLLGEPKP